MRLYKYYISDIYFLKNKQLNIYIYILKIINILFKYIYIQTYLDFN